jgi:hypothetical protein
VIFAVPVPAELDPYAHYPVDSITFCRRGNLVELGYKLPELLLGKAERVGFSGGYDSAAGVLALTGNGTATCELAGGSWSCLEHFVGIAVDLEAVAKAAEDLPPAEAAGRIDVAEVFGATRLEFSTSRPERTSYMRSPMRMRIASPSAAASA